MKKSDKIILIILIIVMVLCGIPDWVEMLFLRRI